MSLFCLFAILKTFLFSIFILFALEKNPYFESHSGVNPTTHFLRKTIFSFFIVKLECFGHKKINIVCTLKWPSLIAKIKNEEIKVWKD